MFEGLSNYPIMTNFLMLKIGFTKGPDRLAGHLGNHKLISKQPLG